MAPGSRPCDHPAGGAFAFREGTLRAILLMALLSACMGEPARDEAPTDPLSVPTAAPTAAPGAPTPVEPSPVAPPTEPAAPATPLPTPPAVPATRPAPAPRALSSSPARLWACEVDADCVIECDLPGECCGAPCGCRTAVNRHVLADLKTQPWVECTPEERRRCPDVACAYEPAWAARCADGRCRSVDGPGL